MTQRNRSVPPASTPVVPTERLRAALEAQAVRLAARGREGWSQLSSLIEVLEIGAIAPRTALRELSEEQAELVRRIALAGLLALQTSWEEP